MLAPSVISIIGTALSGMPMTILATTDVERKNAGLASGLFQSMRTLGGSVAIGVISSICGSFTTDEVKSLMSNQGLLAPTASIIKQAASDGFARGYFLSACVCIVGTAFVLMIPNQFPTKNVEKSENKSNTAPLEITPSVVIQIEMKPIENVISLEQTEQ